jgi:predicted NAD/FAD-binding protein
MDKAHTLRQSVTNTIFFIWATLEYIAMGLFNESYVVSQGVEAVVKQLIAPVKHVHLATEIVSMEPVFVDEDDPLIRVVDANGQAYVFDHIIFATQGNQALQLIQRYKESVLAYKSEKNGRTVQRIVCQLEDQMSTLSRFHYDTSLVINHKDTSLLPRDRSSWRALNLAVLDKSIKLTDTTDIIPYPHDTTMTTHILNMTHANIGCDTVYLQTTNPIASPKPESILSMSWFQRATVTLDSKEALKDLFCSSTTNLYEKNLGDRQGKARLWFCGSYAWSGIPLLEGCVVSAEKVVTEGICPREGIDVVIPW